MPVLFRLGSVAVHTHDFFVLLGVGAATAMYFLEARRSRRLEPRLVCIALGALFWGAVGAKVSTVWRYWSAVAEPSLQGVLVYGGKSILGGLAFAYAGALLTKRLVGYRESTGDMFAPGVALGMTIGRWGCFLTEQIGTPTSLPWGLRVEAAVASRVPNCPYCELGVPMHPSFIYEIVFHAVMFGMLQWLRPRIQVRGDLFKIYLLTYASFRFGVEFVRGNPEMWLGLTGSQLFLVPATALLSLYFLRRWMRDAQALRERTAE